MFLCVLVGRVTAEGVKAFGLTLLWEHDLRDVSFHVRAGHTPDSFVSFSPDGQLLALGTLTGDLFVFESRNGRVILKKRIPEAMVKRVAFSLEGTKLYYGEQSEEGAVCALSLASGKKLWCFRTARDLERGSPPPPGDLYGIYHLPGIYRLKVLQNGDLLVLAVHSWFDRKRRLWRRLSRLYRLSPQGEPRWSYPERGPAPVTIIYADSDPKGKLIAGVALLPSEDTEDLERFSGPSPQSFFLLRGRDGKVLFEYRLKPLKPYFDRVSAWESVAVSPRGDFALLGTSDGRLFIFELFNKDLRHVLSLAAPIKFGPFPVSASLGYGLFDTRGVAYVLSGESTLPYGLPLAIDRPVGPHPAARTLFALDPSNGKILWRFVSPMKLQGLAVSPQGNTLAVATAAFRKEEAVIKQFGILVFDLNRSGGGLSRLAGYYPTAGPCFFHLAVSPDGEMIATVETPWRDEAGRLFGRHRLLLLRRQK